MSKLWAWVEFIYVKIGHFIMAVLGFPLLPFAFLLKYGFGAKNLWLLNDTVDGDFGDFKWKLRKLRAFNPRIRILIKIYLALFWYFRNSVWNLKLLTSPPWGERTDIEVVINQVRSPFAWVVQKDRGINLIYFKINGNTYFRLSFTYLINFQAGLRGGDDSRYNLKLRTAED